jgi:hypothetical protein
MGRFIYVSRPFNKIETQLIRDHRFKPLSYDEYDKIRMQFLGTINKKEESFCKRVYKGKKIGQMTPTLAQLSDKNNTMLVLTKGDNIVDASDIKAVVGFKIINKLLYINGVCSNQVTKSSGGDLLVTLVQKVCNKHGITKRNVVSKSRVTKRIFH